MTREDSQGFASFRPTRHVTIHVTKAPRGLTKFQKALHSFNVQKRLQDSQDFTWFRWDTNGAPGGRVAIAAGTSRGTGQTKQWDTSWDTTGKRPSRARAGAVYGSSTESHRGWFVHSFAHTSNTGCGFSFGAFMKDSCTRASDMLSTSLLGANGKWMPSVRCWTGSVVPSPFALSVRHKAGGPVILVTKASINIDQLFLSQGPYH